MHPCVYIVIGVGNDVRLFMLILILTFLLTFCVGGGHCDGYDFSTREKAAYSSCWTLCRFEVFQTVGFQGGFQKLLTLLWTKMVYSWESI